MKQITFIIISSVFMHIYACGQEKKPNVSQEATITNNTTANFTQPEKSYQKEDLKNAILIEYDDIQNIQIKFYDSQGVLSITKDEDDFLKYHPYYKIIEALSKRQHEPIYFSGGFTLSDVSLSEKKELFSSLSNKLSDKAIEQIDYVNFELRHLRKDDEILKVFLYEFALVLSGKDDKVIFSDSQIIGVDSDEKQVFRFSKDVNSRGLKLVNDKLLFGCYYESNNDPNSESVGTIGPYFIVTIPDGTEYILPKFLGFPNDFSEEQPAGSYDLENIYNKDNQIFMTFSTNVFEGGAYKYFKYVANIDIDKKTFKHARVEDNIGTDSLLNQLLSTASTHRFILKK